jgi:hypothetical protein
VAAQKDRLKKQKERHEALRFTADDIGRAIEAVQQAGLTIYSAEITLNGSMSINTTSPFKRDAPKPETKDAQEEVQPNKKRA